MLFEAKEQLNTVVVPKIQPRANGSGRIYLPKESVNDFEVHGFVDNGRIYIANPSIGAYRCPKGCVRPYFLKRNEKHPKFCADCGEAFL